MAKYRVLSQQFCSLSKEQRWQSWLYSTAEDLHDDLMNHIEKSSSCKANQVKMLEIQSKLEQRGKQVQMIKFLQKEYPHVLEEIKEVSDQKPVKPTSKVVERAEQPIVFSYYKPSLLTFPQKLILENDDPDALRRDVHSFLVGKVSGDYLIVGNKAYIEYFKLKYAREAREIPANQREINQFRAKHGLPASEKIYLIVPSAKITQEAPANARFEGQVPKVR